MDVCGVKQAVVDAARALFEGTEVSFVGAHPMAGREFSGYAHAQADLFRGASLILTPFAETDAGLLAAIERVARGLGFGRVVRAAPEAHDRVIAYTSQLAHVVSNAYVKSPSLVNETGFSAGSFLDLTRVAKLHEGMWAALMTMNRVPLARELRGLIGHLEGYLGCLEAGDETGLRTLLREGRLLKEWSLEAAKPKGTGDANP
jgi:prephenate dehydrogenase